MGPVDRGADRAVTGTGAVGRVVLVRPWTDARAGGGCCGGEARDGVAPLAGPGPERRRAHEHDAVADPVGAAYRALRAQLPDLDVQVVDAGNTAWLLPAVLRRARRRVGTLAAVRSALGATRAGSVLVDGVRVGDLADLDADEVVAVVRRAAAA